MMGVFLVPKWGQACNSTVYRTVWRSVKHFFAFLQTFFVKRFSTFSPFLPWKTRLPQDIVAFGPPRHNAKNPTQGGLILCI